MLATAVDALRGIRARLAHASCEVTDPASVEQAAMTALEGFDNMLVAYKQ